MHEAWLQLTRGGLLLAGAPFLATALFVSSVEAGRADTSDWLIIRVRAKAMTNPRRW